MLPLEVLDHIFSYTDPFDLKACLRAHPIFSKVVQRHLYAHIAILNVNEPNSDSFNPAQLRDLLSSNLRIADYVRSLDMTISPSDERHLKPMVWILPKFRRLQRISLVAPSGVWYSVPKDVREALMECFRLPSMVEVSISVSRSVCYPLSDFVDGIIGLKRLTLDGKFDTSSSTLSFPCLESLSIYKSSTSMLESFIAAKIPKLRSLDFHPSQQSGFRNLSQLLQYCSDTLTSLKINLGINCMSHCCACFNSNTYKSNSSSKSHRNPNSTSRPVLSVWPSAPGSTYYICKCKYGFRYG